MPLALISQIALWVVCLVTLTLVLVLYRQFGLTAMASAAGHDNDGVPIGKPAPPVFLQKPGSPAAPEETTLDGRWSILMFGTPHCSPCVDAMDQLNSAMPRLAEADARVLAALTAKDKAVREFRDSKSYRFDVYLDPDGLTSVAWQVKATPFVLLIGADGRVHSKALASNRERLARFLSEAEEIVAGESPRSVRVQV